MPRLAVHRDHIGRFAKAPPPKPRPWYRVTVQLPRLFKPRGPWRETWAQAAQDAVDEGLGSWDRRAETYVLPVPAVIQVADSIDRPPD